ncbi:MAG: indole-3-glycerol phosphate synthase TrpC [Tannerellaceae bacterium]|jgi:indole-3-glycerol phosphate synthase|nr:indole-3-glycerol phosphate synthase TrpC [Tannerellaceae bacterium]
MSAEQTCQSAVRAGEGSDDILHKIVAAKRLEVERQKKAVSLRTLLALGAERMDRPVYSMSKALNRSQSGIIAEFKRRSPSKGWLFPGALIEDVIPEYQRAGASACSILTDEDFFGGSLGDLQAARKKAGIPLLRKDFIIDEYQLFQSRVMGADAVLLIAAALSRTDCASLASTAHSLGLEVLLEIHGEEELGYLTPEVDMLGVNNRNLGTFHTDVANSFRLTEHIKASAGSSSTVLVSESGISDVDVVRRLRQSGFRGFLIGEAFMKSQQPGEALASFIGGLAL